MLPWEASCYEESPIEYILKRTLKSGPGAPFALPGR